MKIKTVALWTSSILAIVFTVAFFVGFQIAYVDPCTMGAPDGFMAATFVCSPAAVLAIVCFALSGRITKPAAYHRLLIPLGTLVLIWLYLEPIYETVIQGHHLCGEQFDDDIPSRKIITRIYYPFQGLALLAINVSALWPLNLLWLQSSSQAPDRGPSSRPNGTEGGK